MLRGIIFWHLCRLCAVASSFYSYSPSARCEPLLSSSYNPLCHRRAHFHAHVSNFKQRFRLSADILGEIAGHLGLHNKTNFDSFRKTSSLCYAACDGYFRDFEDQFFRRLNCSALSRHIQRESRLIPCVFLDLTKSESKLEYLFSLHHRFGHNIPVLRGYHSSEDGHDEECMFLQIQLINHADWDNRIYPIFVFDDAYGRFRCASLEDTFLSIQQIHSVIKGSSIRFEEFRSWMLWNVHKRYCAGGVLQRCKDITTKLCAWPLECIDILLCDRNADCTCICCTAAWIILFVVVVIGHTI